MSTSKTPSRCWTCKKRRLKCDGGTPTCQKCWGHGVQCLGYKKPLTWVKGVTRRGPMRDRSFGESESSSEKLDQSAYATMPLGIIPVPVTLTEPLFADLDQRTRFFIDYFSKKICIDLVLQDHNANPYRAVITRIRSPAVSTAIVTVASCHYVQYLTDSPLLESLSSSNDQSSSTIIPKSPAASLEMSRTTLMAYYFRTKDLCLKFVSFTLTMHEVADCSDIVIAIVLLAILDVFESGSGAWNVHLDGAKKMLQRQSMTGSLGDDREVKALLNEALTFQILGSSLAKPGVFNSESTLPSTQPGDSSFSTPIGCPAAILSVIETFALERRFNSMVASRIMGAKHLVDALRYLQTYDIPSWATEVLASNRLISHSDLVQLGTIWKLAAEIYASQILFHLTGDVSFLQPLLVDDLIKRYEFLQREDDNLLKCLIWPTFIAGSASIDLKSRDWARKTLERIWQIGHCANTKNATVVLETLWEKFDSVQCQADSPHITSGASGTSMSYQEGNWLDELSLLDGSWLFI